MAVRRADARDLQEVLNTGTLRVGVTLYAPWAARAANGELVGFEVDVAKQLAADMRVKAELRAYDVERLIPALEAGEIDLIAAGLTITPARALHVNFSQPYAEGGIGLATHVARTANVTKLEDLERRHVHDRRRRRLGGRAARAAPVAAGQAPAADLAGRRDEGAARRRGRWLPRRRARADVPRAREPRRHRRAARAAAAREQGGVRGEQGRSRFSGLLERLDRGARSRHLAADHDELLVQVVTLAGAPRRCAKR